MNRIEPGYHHRDPKELWRETRIRVAEKNRVLDLHSDTCSCKYPCEGPSYLKMAWCVRCQRKIR